MGIISAAAQAAAIEPIVEQIEKDLVAHRNNPELQITLKRLGRLCIERHEDPPREWFEKYRELFKE